MTEPERRRRIDRVTAEDYLADLESKPMSEIRAMRDDCREEEPRLSYARRLVQGQLDIVRAESRRRTGGGGDEGLVGALTEILADAPTPRPDVLGVRSAPVFSPDEATYGAREHDTSLEDAAVGRVPDLDDDELEALEQRLVAKENHISSLRRAVLSHLDALSDELIRRYRDGGADVDEIMAGAGGPEQPDS